MEGVIMQQTREAYPPEVAGVGSDLSTSQSSAGKAKAEEAKNQAQQLAGEAKGQTQRVTSEASQQAQKVASQAISQAKDLSREFSGQLRQQADNQRTRLVQGLDELADELQAMVDGSDKSGPATEAVRQATGRLKDFTGYVRDREPADLLEEVRNFARRRPAVFLTGALVAGVVAGRLTRGMRASSAQSNGTTSNGTTAGTQDASGSEYASGYAGTSTSGYAGASTAAEVGGAYAGTEGFVQSAAATEIGGYPGEPGVQAGEPLTGVTGTQWGDPSIVEETTVTEVTPGWTPLPGELPEERGEGGYQR